MVTRIHLEDEGQDLLWLDVENGVICGGGPFHGHIFRGRGIAPKLPLTAGRRLILTNGSVIRYPIVRVEDRDDTGPGDAA